MKMIVFLLRMVREVCFFVWFFKQPHSFSNAFTNEKSCLIGQNMLNKAMNCKSALLEKKVFESFSE